MKSILSDWPFILIQTAVFVFFVLQCFLAQKKHDHWLATLIWGAAFGYFLEVLIVNSSSPGYTYACDKFFCLWHAPIWVGLGWGIVAYASIWTANALSWDEGPNAGQSVRARIVQIASAGFMAVTIDMTLDPVAQIVGLWDWKCDCLLGPQPEMCPAPCPLDASVPFAKLRFFDVPFDNYVGGWFGITAAYAGSVYLVRWLGTKLPAGTPPRLRFVLLDVLAPGPAAGVALAFFWFIARPLAARYYAVHTTDGQMTAFLVLAIVAGIATAFNAAQSKRDKPIDRGIAWVPFFYNVVPFILLVGVDLRSQPALLVSIPSYLLFGMIVFCWPFLDALWDAITARVQGVSRRFGFARAGDDAHP